MNMYTHFKKYFLASLLVLLANLQAAAPASAYPYGYNTYNPYYGSGAYGGGSYYNPYSVFTRHPIVSGTVVGGLVGVAGGAAVGAFAPSERGQGQMGHDAAIGGGAGALMGTGVGLIRNYQIHRYYGY